MTQKEYIETVLINEIGDIMKSHKWLSYILITSGIELLGTLIEKPRRDFHKKDVSGERFRDAINNLFPEKYKKYNDKTASHDLYKELRCGLNHSTLPKITLALGERAHAGQSHLTMTSNNILVLVVEDFFDDFKNACGKVIEKMEKGEIKDRFSVNLI